MIKISDILDDLGLEYREVGADYNLKCWHHPETKPSMFINKENGMYHCFSCDASGNIFSLLKEHKDLSGVEALKYLGNFSKGGGTHEDRLENFKSWIDKRKGEKTFKRELMLIPEYRLIKTHPYLENRGFSDKEIQEWGIGVITPNQKEEKFRGYVGWLLIPILKNGRLRNYFLRSPFANRKRFGEYSVKDILFGLEKATKYDEPIYVVEGIFDMIALRRLGVQVVATLTNRIYEAQSNELRKFKKVIIVPDKDQPGLKLVFNALSLLHDTEVCVCLVPGGKKDAGECTHEELHEIILSEINIIKYITHLTHKNFK